jgi:ArsR family transcriptional regulator
MKDTIKAKNLKKLLDKVRIQILILLYEKDTCACEIVDNTGLENNLVSYHLKTLSDMGYIKAKRNGVHMIYTLKDSKRSIIKKILDLIES